MREGRDRGVVEIPSGGCSRRERGRKKDRQCCNALSRRGSKKRKGRGMHEGIWKKVEGEIICYHPLLIMEDSCCFSRLVEKARERVWEALEHHLG